MASEEVIELGSSEDEAEPAPKKKKPLPNAMVHIPSKLPGVTIKPTQLSSLRIKKGVILNKCNLQGVPVVNRMKPISHVINMPVQNRIVKNKTAALNPFSIVKKLNKTHVAVKNVPQITTGIKIIQLPGQKKFITKLPPSITIKPVKDANITTKSIPKPGASGMPKRVRVIGPKWKHQPEMMTVDLDDEDNPDSVETNPQWYLRPEDQNEENVEHKLSIEVDRRPEVAESSMQENNNKEPDTTKYVEITIEDSPIKPLYNSKHPDIGKELTITIDDSPVKPAKTTKNIESDSEINKVIEDKQSKKKLDYPNDSEKSKENHVLEIEIDLSETSSINMSGKKRRHTPEESEKSPKQKLDTEQVNSLNKNASFDIEQAKEIISDEDEFHPIYQKFIHMCFQLENTDDMKKIVEKKIKAYYRQCPKDYVESEDFLDMVSSKIALMKASPEKMYLYIKDIVDELNLQRKMPKSVMTEKVSSEKDTTTVKYEESQLDSKKQRQIRKLEKTIKKLHRAIQKLEEQEVDFDDEDDSVYLLTERYKERMVRVHAKFCQLTNTKMPSEPRVQIKARPGRPNGPAKKLEKWINRKVAIGTPLPFPDFHDVIRCVRNANEEDKLGWTDIDVMEEARDLFTRCGKKLQRRRQENEWRIASSRISAEVDPAERFLDLKKKLEENNAVAAKKETELLNKYVDRQNLLKLEAVEIGDKEADESPIESEEEDDVVDNGNSMEDKQKRKQRLKRLLHEKSIKDGEKGNIRKPSAKKENNETEAQASKDIVQETIYQCKSIESIENESNNDDTVVESVPNETEATKDTETNKDSVKENKDNDTNDSDNKVESDIDELHLLQKLHSESEANTSTLESSDSDTPIAISDTLESDSEQEHAAKSCDVISIENSSYSESEMIMDGPSKVNDTHSLHQQNVEDLVTANYEIEYSASGIEETNKKNSVKEATTGEFERNICLASSDEEVKDKAANLQTENTCINLKDDNISITETTVDGNPLELRNAIDDENSMPENNDAEDLAEVSIDFEVNNDTVDTTLQNIEDGDGRCENSILECSRTEEGTHDDNDCPKDIVDIRSASDVNSVESTDLRDVIEIKDDISNHAETMDTTESHSPENSEVTEGAADSDVQNQVQIIGKIFNDQSAKPEMSKYVINMEI